MSTIEIQHEDDVPPVALPEPDKVNGAVEAKPKRGRPPKAEADSNGEERGERPLPTDKLSKPLREVQLAEDVALADYIRSLGIHDTDARFVVHRLEPTFVTDPQGRRVKMDGFIRNYDEPVTEQKLQENHGGGKYKIKIMTKDKDGRYVFFKSRNIDLVGDPRIDDVPRNTAIIEPKGAAPAGPGEPTSVVNRAMDVLERELGRANERAAAAPAVVSGVDPAAIEILKETLRRRDDELAQLRQEIVAMRNTPPPRDEIKDKLLGSLIDGESGRITALRATHESEIRQLKEQNVDLERRLRDGFDRDRAAMLASHEREFATMKASHELTLAMNKQSFETQVKVLEGQIRSLERDNTELRADIKELRAKKEKTIIEQVKELEVIKDALGLDEKGESSVADKIVDAISNPETIQAVQHIIRGPGPAAPPPVAAQPAPPRRLIIKAPDGSMVAREPNGELRPVKKRVAPGEVEVPVVPPDQVERAMAMLTTAFGTGKDPTEVAQTLRMVNIPAEIRGAIETMGIDAFMAKVAKIPQGHPFTTQEGRNWVRKVAKALIG